MHMVWAQQWVTFAASLGTRWPAYSSAQSFEPKTTPLTITQTTLNYCPDYPPLPRLPLTITQTTLNYYPDYLLTITQTTFNYYPDYP